jgi:hypothetical protein
MRWKNTYKMDDHFILKANITPVEREESYGLFK